MSIHVVYVEIKKVIFQNVLICVNLVINQGLITTVNVIIAKNIYMIKWVKIIIIIVPKIINFKKNKLKKILK